MNLTGALARSASGMDAQTARLEVIAQNIANSDTTGSTPGADPYRRKTVTFKNVLDQSANPGAAAQGTGSVGTVSVGAVAPDMSAFPTRFDPANPAADASGYVKTPNVNPFVEVMDMKEAQRSYTANLNVMETTRSMMSRAIDLLR